MCTLLLLPHQLFDPKYFPKTVTQVFLYEHPHYFTAFKYNKKRLVLHRASLKAYADELSKAGHKVKYFTFKEKIPSESTTSLIMFDPVDKIKLPKVNKLLETPNFLLTRTDYKKYKGTRFAGFYTYAKKIVNILPNTKSKDTENRNKVPKELKVPKTLPKLTARDRKYIKEASRYIDKHFPNNYGTTNNFHYPVTRSTATSWLTYFLKHKLKKFGTYQDAILKDNNYLYHSVLSAVINISLINPSEIISRLKRIKPSSVGMNNYEGYVRQLFWREFQRYTYTQLDWESFGNYFGNSKRLPKSWYDASTSNAVINNTIKRGFETGYLHHIERLMVIGNFMNLSGIKPQDGFKWFMEFSCDSYLWVMYQNVFEMVFFITGGLTMRKPYVSSSSYILRMSDYKHGPWADQWDKMYRDWVKKHAKKLHKFRYHFPMLRKK